MTNLHKEQDHTSRLEWLRAAILGANDGVVSVSSVVEGVASEYVSVQSQDDTEHADLAKEIRELREQPDLELQTWPTSLCESEMRYDHAKWFG